MKSTISKIIDTEALIKESEKELKHVKCCNNNFKKELLKQNDWLEVQK